MGVGGKIGVSRYSENVHMKTKQEKRNNHNV